MKKHKKALGTPIVVLGMHRSGTSLVAGILRNAGVLMGDKFLPPDEFNLRGYFEDTDFLWINKGILESAGASWYAPPTVELILSRGEKFRRIAQKTIAEKRTKAKRKSWGWKDPRNCLTCWVYSEFIQDAKFIVVVRNPMDIRLSLLKAHGDLANWDSVINLYYASVDKFLQMHKNQSLNVSFEELTYKKYSKETCTKILTFINKSNKFIDKIWSGIDFR